MWRKPWKGEKAGVASFVASVISHRKWSPRPAAARPLCAFPEGGRAWGIWQSCLQLHPGKCRPQSCKKWKALLNTCVILSSVSVWGPLFHNEKEPGNQPLVYSFYKTQGLNIIVSLLTLFLLSRNVLAPPTWILTFPIYLGAPKHSLKFPLSGAPGLSIRLLI